MAIDDRDGTISYMHGQQHLSEKVDATAVSRTNASKSYKIIEIKLKFKTQTTEAHENLKEKT